MSQDIHWSQFDANPIFQNPGNTGHFNGDVRFVGNYRDQWRAVTTPFQTISISADGKPYNHRNLGIGGLFFHDMSGDGTFRTIELQLNASYVFKLSKDSNHIIRPGVNIGMNHRQINWNALSFGNQYNGITYDPTLPTNELYANDRKTNFSAGLGAIYEFNIDKRKQITAGASAFNLNRPNQGFYFTKVRRDIRTNVFLRGTYPLGFDFDLIPSMQLTIQGKYREYMVGSSLKYTLVNRLGTYRAVYAGLWYRNRDAAFLSLGMDYQNWFVGLSYDINFSSLAVASNARGGMEIAVRYVINRFKISKAIHRVCPDYI
jgi:type IX secretion system PorP/SprF family membrane protein